MEMGQSHRLRSERERLRHRCRRKVEELQPVDQVSAVVIVLSVGITLLEACYISHDWIREFSDFAQGLFAAMFVAQQIHVVYNYFAQSTGPPPSLFSFFFTDRRAAWNLFDLVMNVTSLLDIFVTSWEGRFVHGLGAVRVMRVMRLVRLFGSSKFLDDFGRVTHTALWQMLNFSIVIMGSLALASVVATNMLWDFPEESVAANYSDMPTTMWTLFKIMTMDGWIDCVEPLLELHPSLLLFFASFVFFSLSSISIVPAIFIEILIEDREKHKAERRKRQRLRAKLRQQRLELEEDEDSSCNSASSLDSGREITRTRSSPHLRRSSWVDETRDSRDREPEVLKLRLAQEEMQRLQATLHEAVQELRRELLQCLERSESKRSLALAPASSAEIAPARSEPREARGASEADPWPSGSLDAEWQTWPARSTSQAERPTEELDKAEDWKPWKPGYGLQFPPV